MQVSNHRREDQRLPLHRRATSPIAAGNRYQFSDPAIEARANCRVRLMNTTVAMVTPGENFQRTSAPKAMSKPAPLLARPTRRIPAHSRTCVGVQTNVHKRVRRIVHTTTGWRQEPARMESANHPGAREVSVGRGGLRIVTVFGTITGSRTPTSRAQRHESASQVSRSDRRPTAGSSRRGRCGGRTPRSCAPRSIAE
jgi:hypothetical protein